MSSTPIDFSKTLDTSILKDKTAIVTGGASGIGWTLATALSEAGAYVTIADIDTNQEHRNSTWDSSKDQHPIDFIKTDVTIWEAQKAAFKHAANRTDRETVDIVISAAGIRTQLAYMPRPTPGLAEEPRKPPTATLDINFTGTYFTASLAAHYFALSDPNPAKQMLFISSMAAYSQSKSPLLAADYAGSKFGVRGLFHQYRRPDIADSHFGGARFNCLAPFFIATPMIKEEEVKAFEAGGWKVGTLGDVRVGGMRCLANEDVKGRAVIVCKGEEKEGDRCFDACDDLENGYGVKELMAKRDWFGGKGEAS